MVMAMAAGAAHAQTSRGAEAADQPLRLSRPQDAHERQAVRVAAGREHRASCRPAVSDGSDADRRLPPEFDGLLRQAHSEQTRLSDTGRRALGDRWRGEDFRSVRIFAGPRAAAAAGSVDAAAFTIGRDIYFGAGRFAPDTRRGKALLAHELAHTLNSPPGMVSRQPNAAAEPDHDAVEPPGPLDEVIDRAAILLAHSTSRVLPMPLPAPVLAAIGAAEVGFISQALRRLAAQGEWRAVLRRVAELNRLETAASVAGRYLLGVLEGLISPITGMRDLVVGGYHAVGWVIDHAHLQPGLLSEALGLQEEFSHFQHELAGALRAYSERGKLVEFASAVFSAVEEAGTSIEHELVDAARRKGVAAANALVHALRQDPLAELAETAGRVVGTVVIEVVLLVTSGGIGNLIEKLGLAARELVPLSRGAVEVAEFVIRFGRRVDEIERILTALLNRTVLRPLQPLFHALEPLLVRLRQFLRRAFGLAEEGGASGAGAVARQLERGPAHPGGSTPPGPASPAAGQLSEHAAPGPTQLHGGPPRQVSAERLANEQSLRDVQPGTSPVATLRPGPRPQVAPPRQPPSPRPGARPQVPPPRQAGPAAAGPRVRRSDGVIELPRPNARSSTPAPGTQPVPASGSNLALRHDPLESPVPSTVPEPAVPQGVPEPVTRVPEPSQQAPTAAARTGPSASRATGAVAGVAHGLARGDADDDADSMPLTWTTARNSAGGWDRTVRRDAQRRVINHTVFTFGRRGYHLIFTGGNQHWENHHTWPQFLAGLPGQQTLPVRAGIHQSFIHTAIVDFLQAKGHRVTGRRSDPETRDFVARLRLRRVFRRQVHRHMCEFYAAANDELTSPLMPDGRYQIGLDQTLAALGG